MAGDNQLFHIDAIVIDGQAMDFEDSTATISGAAGFTNTPVLSSGTSDDYVKRARVARMLKARLQWNSTSDPKSVANMRNVQISMRDGITGRKCLAPKASFSELGDIGGGSVDVTFALLSELQWL